jgi:hypothetical protein
MRQTIYFHLFGAVIAVATCSMSVADTGSTLAIEFDRFWRESDTVVIAHPVSTSPGINVIKDERGKILAREMVTKFDIELILKGGPKGPIEVGYYRAESVLYSRGRLLPEFPAKVGGDRADYVLFLKRRAVGSYEIINGGNPGLASFFLEPTAFVTPDGRDHTSEGRKRMKNDGEMKAEDAGKGDVQK